jgi:hypothetical protein
MLDTVRIDQNLVSKCGSVERHGPPHGFHGCYAYLPFLGN